MAFFSVLSTLYDFMFLHNIKKWLNILLKSFNACQNNKYIESMQKSALTKRWCSDDYQKYLSKQKLRQKSSI